MKDSSNITDYDIQALVDDELSAEKAEKIIALLENNPEARRRYHELVSQKKLLQLWWAEGKN